MFARQIPNKNLYPMREFTCSATRAISVLKGKKAYESKYDNKKKVMNVEIDFKVIGGSNENQPIQIKLHVRLMQPVFGCWYFLSFYYISASVQFDSFCSNSGINMCLLHV